jgi:ATP-binding cassette, subfamily B (MDR/TAP), member 1
MLGNTAPILPLFGGASAAYQRLLRDIEAPSLIDATSEQGQVLSGDIKSVDVQFNGVSFAYPSRPTQPVLRNVDLSFPTGRYTAIVGLSGSGKSTVAALLSRLYDPTEGSITIDGHDVKDLNVRSLRSLMGFVQQEPSLMNGSIFSNIARGLVNSPGFSHAHLKDFLYSVEMEELSDKGRDIMNAAKGFGPQAEEICRLVQDAAEQADAAAFIERLENGYGTSVGPKGSLLSGGQRQRVALAQALIRDPRILVLDEATSALDSASERRIQGAVERAAKHRTVICIAHRLSTIRNADTIIVMEAGQAVEQGSYTELMAREGTTFERMVKLQSLAHKDKGDGGSISGDSVGASTLKADTVDFEKNEKIDEPTEEIEAKKEETQASDSALDAVQPASSVWRTLARFIRPSLPWLLMAMGAAFIVGLTFPSSGTIIGVTVGELNPCSNTPDHIRQNGRLFGGLLFMLAVIELFANFAAWSCFGVVAEKLLYLIRVLCFRSLMEQDIHWHQAESPAKLLAIITKDSAAVGGFSGSTLGTVFSILVNFVAAIVLSHIIAWKIALVCLASVPILLGCGFMQLRMLARYEERTAGAFANAAAVAVEAVQSIRTVAVLSLEKETMSIFSRLLRGPQQQILRASASTNIWLAMTHSTGKLVYCLSYWWGSRFIMRGEYSQTQFFIVLISMLVSAQLWATMFNLAPEFSRAHTAMSRTMNIIRLGSTQDVSKVVMGASSGAGGSDVEATGESGEPSSPAQAGENRGVGIRFDKVSFAYPNRPDVSVLDEVSLTIQPGQFVGLVGPSGAGKSTIMSLVQRLYNPTSGTISLDDRDISSINTSAFRDNIALVPQDPTLFSGTIRFNVSLGAAPGHEATDEEIKEACRLANIHHVIESLPDGYDTDCGAGASRLSGGQRQRLAIARALVRRPRLLLLDESTSALDAESEAALQEGLERASKGTTVLAITHRLHTVQKANVIFVVEGGRIVDSGRHADLMERNQSYSVNATQQMLQ